MNQFNIESKKNLKKLIALVDLCKCFLYLYLLKLKTKKEVYNEILYIFFIYFLSFKYK